MQLLFSRKQVYLLRMFGKDVVVVCDAVVGIGKLCFADVEGLESRSVSRVGSIGRVGYSSTGRVGSGGNNWRVAEVGNVGNAGFEVIGAVFIDRIRRSNENLDL